jgi:4-amino-4-deoxy-L-arabinose transferase-like glycosyltransferase
MTESPAPQTVSTPRPWWLEWEMLLLIGLVLFGYVYRASDMSMRGEEPRRAEVAREMIERGDWVMPRYQGTPFYSRPPLHNWLIALSFLGVGEYSPFAARLPSLLATLVIVLMIYGYGRTFLSRTGALAAAAAYATFGEMLQMGRQAETEAVFIMLVTGSLLVWHWGIVRGWPAAWTWSLGYAFMALGGLTKGPQAPFYFLGSVGVYLLWTRQWRMLFSCAHLLGILVAAAILAAWHVPYYQRCGMFGIHAIWMNDTAPRLLEWDGLLEHLITFPLEVLGCTLPWSPLIVLFVRRDVRSAVAAARPQITFLTICLAIAFPTCWLPPGGMTRYIAPIYPCFALMLGFVVQRCGEAAAQSPLAITWRRFLDTMAGVMFLAGIGCVVVLFAKNSRLLGPWAEPVWFAASFCAAGVAFAWWTRRTTRAPLRWATGWSVTALAGFMVLLFNGPVLNAKIRRGEDCGAEIVRLKDRLGGDATFVSLGLIDSEFPFFYGTFVEPLPWPSETTPAVREGGYFCFNAAGFDRPQLPFAWEELAAISMDRNRHAIPERVLVVARRLSVANPH